MILAAALLACLSPSAVAYTTTFPVATFAPLGSQIAGKDGWTISDPGADSSPVFPLSYSTYLPDKVTLKNSVAAELGGYYDPPPAPSPTTVFLSHDAAGQLQNTSFSVDFAVQGSGEPYSGRDGFGFALRDAGDHNLLSVVLIPVTGGSGDAYQVAYAVGSAAAINAHDANSSLIYVHQSGLYTLSLNLTPNAANPAFSATITGTNSQTFTGTATGLGSAVVGRFGALWNVTDAVAGNNGLIFDNVAVVQGSAAPALPLILTLTLSGPTLRFSWPSQTGRIYQLRGSTSLATAPATWPLMQANLAATPPTNTLALAKPADPQRFYVIEEDSP